MTLVVDASVAAKWFVEEPRWEAARALLTSDQELVAPEFLLVEVANAFAKKMRAGEMSLWHAQGDVDTIKKGAPEFFDSRPLMSDALELSEMLNHSVYDCLYLALAIHEDTRVVTDDQRFHKRVAASELVGYTTLLGERPPPPGG